MRYYSEFYHRGMQYPGWVNLNVPDSAYEIYRNDPLNIHHWNPQWALENVYPLLKLDDEVRDSSWEKYIGWNGRQDTNTQYHRLFVGAHVGGLYGSPNGNALLLHCDSMSIPIAPKLIGNYGCVFFDDIHNPQPIPDIQFAREHHLYCDIHNHVFGNHS